MQLQQKMWGMVRVLMLAPISLDSKEFLKGKIYFVDKDTAEHLIFNHAAKIITSFKEFENKQNNH